MLPDPDSEINNITKMSDGLAKWKINNQFLNFIPECGIQQNEKANFSASKKEYANQK